MSDNRVEMSILGKDIGTATGWDVQDTFALLFIEFERNDLGRRFVPDFEDGKDLAVNFDTGTVSVYDLEGNETKLEAHWSAFDLK